MGILTNQPSSSISSLERNYEVTMIEERHYIGTLKDKETSCSTYIVMRNDITTTTTSCATTWDDLVYRNEKRLNGCMQLAYQCSLNLDGYEPYASVTSFRLTPSDPDDELGILTLRQEGDSLVAITAVFSKSGLLRTLSITRI